jgi:SAM-dependent methyltransferase
VAAYYDRAADAIPEFTVLNYGYSAELEVSLIPQGHPEYYCLRLYEHTVRDAPIEGADVLEVSCGRGGAARFIYSQMKPQRYVGLDLSRENVAIATAAAGGPEYLCGNAQDMQLDDASFDVVINVEASHLYDDRRQFFLEVHRVLKPAGMFCYTDGCWADDNCSADLLAAGFAIEERLEITPNVIRALELDSDRRTALFDGMAREDLREEYKDWGGVVGYRAHRRFVDGETRYFSHRLIRR